MGDRASIAFKQGNQESVSLFSHWGGQEFQNAALEYARKLKAKINKRKKETNLVQPLHRMNPETVIVDFIRHLTKDMESVSSDLYLGKDENDGDNSDNGHAIIDLKNL